MSTKCHLPHRTSIRIFFFLSQSLMKHRWNSCYDAVLGREKYLGEGSANSWRHTAVTWSSPCLTSYPRVLTQEQQRAVSVRADAWTCGHRSSHCLGKPCLSDDRAQTQPSNPGILNSQQVPKQHTKVFFFIFVLFLFYFTFLTSEPFRCLPSPLGWANWLE